MSPEMTRAAAEYYGIDPDKVAKAEVYSADGQVHIAFQVTPSDEELLDILERRAKAMPELAPAFVPGPSPEVLRVEYNAMTSAERGKYGSFAEFVRHRGVADVRRVGEGWQAGPGLADGSAA